MANDHIRYDLLTQNALRGVVREVLSDVARNGLPGEHHFMIVIDTNAEGVRLSPRLKAQWPEEITVVLQYQFYDLTAKEDRFEVGLSFGGVTERLVVPYTAIKGFYDPSVQFALQFELEGADDDSEAAASDGGAEKSGPRAVTAPGETRPKAAITSGAAAEAVPSKRDADGLDPDRPAGGAEIVRIDRFRKK